MTIIEAGAHLYRWFSENDCYRPEEDYSKLVLISETQEEDRAAIECALESLEEASVIKKKRIEEKEYWILHRKFNSLEQSVLISPKTALTIYQHVRMYTETLGDDVDHECDIMNISERDVHVLVDTIKILSTK